MKKALLTLMLALTILLCSCSADETNGAEKTLLPHGKYEILLIQNDREDRCTLSISENEGVILEYTDERSPLCGRKEEATQEGLTVRYLDLVINETNVSLPSKRIQNILMEARADNTVVLNRNGKVLYQNKNFLLETDEAKSFPLTLTIHDKMGQLVIKFPSADSDESTDRT